MLEQYYTKDDIYDGREWKVVMPISKKEIKKSWKGFLLECVLASRWPSLTQRLEPDNYPVYNKIKLNLKV